MQSTPLYNIKDRMDFYRPHAKSSLDGSLLNQIKKTYYGTVLGYDVWGVRGKIIRNFVDIDFTTGGNPGRYRYVPPLEIWYEDMLVPDDATPVIIHETGESIQMILKGTGYDDAHERINVHEYIVRTAVKNGDLVISTLDDGIRFANAYLNRLR